MQPRAHNAKWRIALRRKVAALPDSAFGGNSPALDRDNAVQWLRGRPRPEQARDMKVVVRSKWIEQRQRFVYCLCIGSCGYSAADVNVTASVVEGVDF